MSVDDIVAGLEQRTASDGTVDYIDLTQQITVISKIGSLLFGFLSTVIFILVPFIVTMEIIYICFPIIREKMEKLIVKVESAGISSRVIGFTLGDARNAVIQADVLQTGKSALWIYLVNKCKSIMFVMFILCSVLNGSGAIINIVWSLIETAVKLIF